MIGKVCFQEKVLEKIYLCEIKISSILTLYYAKINSKSIVDLNVRDKIIKLLFKKA